MTTPSLEFYRFLAGCLFGLALGLVYSFFRPLRPKHTKLTDSLFLLTLFWAWLYQGFGVCRGDLRLGYYAGFPLGILVFLNTLGRLLSPIFTLFWRGVGVFFQGLSRPVTFIFEKTKKFSIFLLASAKKTGTIKWKNNDRYGGGKGNGRQKKHFQPHTAKIPPQLTSAQMYRTGSNRIIYDLSYGHSERDP